MEWYQQCLETIANFFYKIPMKIQGSTPIW